MTTTLGDKVRNLSEMSADRASLRIQGIGGSAYALQVTNIDWKLPEDRWITGGLMMINQCTWGDTFDIEIVDLDGVVTTAGTVLATHVKDFRVNPGQNYQGEFHSQYPALIPAGVYIRIKYDNTSSLLTTKIGLNLITHIPKDIL